MLSVQFSFVNHFLTKFTVKLTSNQKQKHLNYSRWSNETIDYSEVIREWASHPKRQLGPFTTAKMEETTIEDLTVRFGYPYVYMHQVTYYFDFNRNLHLQSLHKTQPFPVCCKVFEKYCSMHIFQLKDKKIIVFEDKQSVVLFRQHLFFWILTSGWQLFMLLCHNNP